MQNIFSYRKWAEKFKTSEQASDIFSLIANLIKEYEMINLVGSQLLLVELIVLDFN